MEQRTSAPGASARGGSSRAVWGLVLGMVTIAATLAVFTLGADVAFLRRPWGFVVFLALAAMFAATEVFSVHLHFSRNSHSFSLFEVPLTIGLFFATGPTLLLAHALGSALALAAHRRQPPVKLLFNVATLVLADQVAIVVFRAVAGSPGAFSSAATGAAAAGVLAASTLSAVSVVGVISVAEGHWRDRRLLTSIAFGCVSALISTSLGLIAVGIIAAYPYAAWLLLVPSIGLYFANHAYTTERRRHHGLEFLHDSTMLLHGSAELESALGHLVERAREAFRASYAELVYVPADGEPVVAVVTDVAGETNAAGGRRAGADEALLSCVAAGEPALVTRTHPDATVRAYLEACDLMDAMVAPLRGEARALGVLVVANRNGDVARFDRDDLVLLATLANNVVAALENGRLEQSLDQLRQLERRLTHQATHDGLTELANRSLFTRQVAEALDVAEATGSSVGVLFIDLDDFKTVNDSLGHAAGDELLVVLGRRLRSAAPAGATAARLGGDEFAVVVPVVGHVAEIVEIGERLLAAVASPASIVGRVVPVRASVGATVSNPGQDAAELLRNADTAMYAAKGRGKNRVAAFEPALHTAALHRYNLTYELDRALEDGEFVAYLQPIVHLVDGSTVGAEALVRWHHPTLGPLLPGSFLSIAEESGAVVRIGRTVLEQVCAFLGGLEAVPGGGPRLTVSVNLSAHDLGVPTLVDDVAQMAARYGVDPAVLVFEVTEGLMISDPVAAARNLARLRGLGARIALDDFGTGYSSLSQLGDLPVDILKIAQPFVDELGRADSGRRAGLVGAVVGLGETLGLTVVAEGIERREQAEQLIELGCRYGQGFYYAAALDRGAFVERLAGSAGNGRSPAALARYRADL